MLLLSNVFVLLLYRRARRGGSVAFGFLSTHGGRWYSCRGFWFSPPRGRVLLLWVLVFLAPKGGVFLGFLVFREAQASRYVDDGLWVGGACGQIHSRLMLRCGVFIRRNSRSHQNAFFELMEHRIPSFNPELFSLRFNAARRQMPNA